jgi:hypothetical protein
MFLRVHVHSLTTGVSNTNVSFDCRDIFAEALPLSLRLA